MKDYIQAVFSYFSICQNKNELAPRTRWLWNALTSWLVAEVLAGAVRLLIPPPLPLLCPCAVATTPRGGREIDTQPLSQLIKESKDIFEFFDIFTVSSGRIWFYFGKGTGYQKNSDRVNSFLLENSSWTSVYSNCYRRNRGLVLKVAYLNR